MIKLIIGQNAIGKTAYLKNEIKTSVVANNSVLSNIFKHKIENRTYKQDRIEQLEDIIDADRIIQNKDQLFIETDMLPIRKDLLNILTIICKESEMLFLDEPEYALCDREIAILVMLLSRVQDTFKRIEIATKSSLLFGLDNNIKKTVVYNTNNNKFELTDIKGDPYETID